MRLVTLLAAVLLLVIQGCASLPENRQRQHSVAVDETEDTRLGRDLRPLLFRHPGESGFVLLKSGLDAFVARAGLAAVAERSIDLQYYLFHQDLVGQLVMHQLLEAADRGVRVRILLDDIDMGRKDMGASILNSHPNIEIRQFNPFARHGALTGLQFVTRFGSVTRRMHNKSFTVDNQATIVGGRNIGNEYFAAHPDLDFKDLDAMAIGPVVREVSGSFDKYWSSELAYPISTLVEEPPSPADLEEMRSYLNTFFQEQRESQYAVSLRESDLARQLREDSLQLNWGVAEAVYDEPEKITQGVDAKELHLTPRLAPYINELANELIVISAYFVPGREGVDFFRKLRERGVRVRILTNALSSTDVSIVHAGYSKYRRPMLEAGIELYEMNEPIVRTQTDEVHGLAGSSKSSLHAKVLIFDRRDLFVGSLNMDPRAVDQNTELGIVFNSPEIGEELGRGFDEKIDKHAFRLELYENPGGEMLIRWKGIEDGEPRVFYTDPYTSLWRRLWIGFVGLLPIESQL